MGRYRSRSRSNEDIAPSAKGKGGGKGKTGGQKDFELQMRLLKDCDVICSAALALV